MKEKLKNTNAITLIALIITIIVLLILAMVSIKLVWDGGIITHAQNASNKYTIEQEKEQISLGYSNYKMANVNDSSASLTVEEAIVDGTGPWTITFNETGNRYKLKENGEIDGPKPNIDDKVVLEKYLLGKKIMDVMNIENMTFLDDPDSITDASTSLTVLYLTQYGTEGYLYFKYENAAYKLVCDSESFENKSVSLVYTPDKEKLEGTTVKYSYDGTKEHEEDWIILYNNGDNLEIVSPSTMGELTLGSEDEQAQGNSAIEKAIYSYNNAVTRINQYCSDLVTNSNKIAVRSVGSNPNNPNEDNVPMYTSEKFKKWNAEEYNGRLKSEDANLVQDIVRMKYWGVDKTEDESWYWLASREKGEGDDNIIFYLRYINSTDGRVCTSSEFLNVSSRREPYCYLSDHIPVRPVVKINS